MRMRAVPAILALLIAASATASRATRAEECLASPNGTSPSGKHWYYRIDRSTHRHCWYLGTLDARRHRAASPRAAVAAARQQRANPDPEPAEDAPEPEAASPAPAPQAAPQPALATRWPNEPPPSVAADGAQPQNRLADAGIAVLPDRIAPRTVPVERVVREPAAPKPPQPATVRLAAAPPAAASPPAAANTIGALPAALFGFALLLGVMGIMLVRARRRFIVRVTETPFAAPYIARGRDEHVERLFTRIRRGLRGRADEEQMPERRSLSQILADVDAADALAAHHAEDSFAPRPANDAFAPHRADEEAHPSFANDATPDIAAATLQPAIEPLPAEPIEPAPDVEASLRQLLAAWERRAA